MNENSFNMDALRISDGIFFANMDHQQAVSIVEDALHGFDDGDLFLEHHCSEALSFDDGRLQTASADTHRGFGLRAIRGEASALAHGVAIGADSLQKASASVRELRNGGDAMIDLAPALSQTSYYPYVNPLSDIVFKDKLALLEAIDAYARAKDQRVKQVKATLVGSWQVVQIIRPDGGRYADVRPLVRLNVQVTVKDKGKVETGTQGGGGRAGYNHWFESAVWQSMVDDAVSMALINLDAEPAPAGEMTVVLGPGWPGILLHEAIGHGLEADFNRKKVAAFSALMGQRIAAPGITVVDDATLDGRRGSLSIDDEGTVGQSTMLIEDGILTGYMYDRLNACLMGRQSTGNGRRQSHAHTVMPRMTNTYMLAGNCSGDEIIASVKDGIYATNFGGGQVDITSGKFVFSASQAYRIEDGKIGAPIKGATLIGDGRSALTQITMVGNDMGLDQGIGTCGKEGQMVPVGVGQPTLRIEQLTVGGTQS